MPRRLPALAAPPLVLTLLALPALAQEQQSQGSQSGNGMSFTEEEAGVPSPQDAVGLYIATDTDALNAAQVDPQVLYENTGITPEALQAELERRGLVDDVSFTEEEAAADVQEGSISFTEEEAAEGAGPGGINLDEIEPYPCDDMRLTIIQNVLLPMYPGVEQVPRADVFVALMGDNLRLAEAVIADHGAGCELTMLPGAPTIGTVAAQLRTVVGE